MNKIEIKRLFIKNPLWVKGSGYLFVELVLKLPGICSWGCYNKVLFSFYDNFFWIWKKKNDNPETDNIFYKNQPLSIWFP